MQVTVLVSPFRGIPTPGSFPCILKAIAVEFAPRVRLDLRRPLADKGKEIRMIRRCSLLLVLMLAAVAFPLRAQTGCDDSPEDPTIVLALVGGAGALAASVRAARSRKR